MLIDHRAERKWEPSGLKPDAKVIAFIGPDGIGKSTLVQTLHLRLRETQTNPVLLVKGTDPESWTDSKYKTAFSSIEKAQNRGDLHETPHNPKSRLYRFLATACYGFVRDLTQQGHSVVLDSDPFLKWLTWERLYGQDLEVIIGRELVGIQKLVGGFIPKNVAYVHGAGDINQQTEAIWNQLEMRQQRLGSINPHDPQNFEQVHERIEANVAVIDVLRGIQKQGVDLNIIDVEKISVPREEIHTQAQNLSQLIESKIS